MAKHESLLIMYISLVLILLAPLDILSYSRDARLCRSALLEPASRRVNQGNLNILHACVSNLSSSKYFNIP